MEDGRWSPDPSQVVCRVVTTAMPMPTGIERGITVALLTGPVLPNSFKLLHSHGKCEDYTYLSSGRKLTSSGRKLTSCSAYPMVVLDRIPMVVLDHDSVH